MSCLLLPNAFGREDRTKSPELVLLTLSDLWLFAARPGLELDAYRMGDESGGDDTVSQFYVDGFRY